MWGGHVSLYVCEWEREIEREGEGTKEKVCVRFAVCVSSTGVKCFQWQGSVVLSVTQHIAGLSLPPAQLITLVYGLKFHCSSHWPSSGLASFSRWTHACGFRFIRDMMTSFFLSDYLSVTSLLERSIPWQDAVLLAISGGCGASLGMTI